MTYGIYWTVVFIIGHTAVTEVLDSAHLPWRTVLETDLKEPTASLCKLPAYPQNGSYVVVAEPGTDSDPGAKPGDVFENVSIVQYTTTANGQSIEIKALKCTHGKWSESIMKYTSDKLYFNTSWCPLLCSPSDLDYREAVFPSVKLTDSYAAIKQNMGAQKLCILPPYPDRGVYRVLGKPDARPGDAFDRVKIAQYVFIEDSGLYEVKEMRCAAGQWYTTQLEKEGEKLILSKRVCPVLCAAFLVENSSEPSENRPTSNVGTAVNNNNQTKCKLPPYPIDGNYTVMNRPEALSGDVLDSVQLYYSCHLRRDLIGSREIYCIDGDWSDVMPKCIQCGSIKPMVVEGASSEEALRREVPWHVAIYDKTKSYEHICSGSIVATNLIVTAAHCFWSDVGELQAASRFAVAAGKVYNDWSSSSDTHSQKSDVSKIIIHPRFRGSRTNFKNDMALVFLDITLNYTDFVAPICLNFDVQLDEKQSKDVKIGKTASWNSSGEGQQEVLKLKVDWTPYVDTNICISEGTTNFRRYVTSDKICAGNIEDPVLCKGDSGGSLSYHMWTNDGSRLNYLRGVASALSADGGACDAHTAGIFTHVLRHEDFFKEHLKEAIWS